jgi:hypothetical protein
VACPLEVASTADELLRPQGHVKLNIRVAAVAQKTAQEVRPCSNRSFASIDVRNNNPNSKGETMKTKFLTVVLAVAAGFTGIAPRANAAAGDSITFNLKVSAGAAACLATNAGGRVNISDLGPVQNMHVEVFNMPPKTEFALFLLQVPKSPFGLSWYQGDIETNSEGKGVADLTGIFSKETFIQAPNVAPAPVVFPDNAASNPATRPVQIYHLGIWFADPQAAGDVNCPSTSTNFDGDHIAGIQVLNTSNFPDNHGPLLNLQ